MPGGKEYEAFQGTGTTSGLYAARPALQQDTPPLCQRGPWRRDQRFARSRPAPAEGPQRHLLPGLGVGVHREACGGNPSVMTLKKQLRQSCQRWRAHPGHPDNAGELPGNGRHIPLCPAKFIGTGAVAQITEAATPMAPTTITSAFPPASINVITAGNYRFAVDGRRRC